MTSEKWAWWAVSDGKFAHLGPFDNHGDAVDAALEAGWYNEFELDNGELDPCVRVDVFEAQGADFEESFFGDPGGARWTFRQARNHNSVVRLHPDEPER